MMIPLNSDFLQSSEWERFQKSLGRKTWRVQGALVIRHELPLGFCYLYSPHPASGVFLVEAREVVKEERAIFLKIDPHSESRITSPASRITNSLQPQKTIILDLQKSEEELRVAMHEKTRYNIRLAERKGVQIKNQESRIKNKDLDIFWNLLRETAVRDKFHTHPRGYYEKLLEIHSPIFSSELFFSEYRGKMIAAALINFYLPSATATYLHGASSQEHRDVMAPHLLQWCIIQEAKRRGFRYYDFWGIDGKKWPGVTRFKMGFGGDAVEYPSSVDIVYRPALYRLYKFVRSVRPLIPYS